VGDELLIGVDLVPVLLGELLRRPQRLAERHEHDADRRYDHPEHRRERHVR